MSYEVIRSFAFGGALIGGIGALGLDHNALGAACLATAAFIPASRVLSSRYKVQQALGYYSMPSFEKTPLKRIT